jgi:TPR repeat protein
LLEVSYFASVYECLLLKDVEVPEMLRPRLEDFHLKKNDEEDDLEDYEFRDNVQWEMIYPVMELKNCGFDRSLTYSAISQAFYARDFIEDLGRPPHEITLDSLDSELSYGNDSQEMLTKVDKIYSSYKYSKGIENLGQEYLHGNNLLGIEPNYEEALNYFSKSVDLGNPAATANLGKMYLKGLGVDQNTTKGMEYLEQAAEAGSLDALRQLSVVYQRGEVVPRNKTKAFDYAKKAADKGDVQSLNNIGVYYLEGIGVEADPVLGVAYIERASDLGSPAAMYNLATIYFNGDHREIDLELAFELSLKVIHSAQQDGYMEKAYERYKTKDFEGAFLYFLFAESLGYIEASKSIAYLLEKDLKTFTCKSGMFYCLGRHLFRGVLKMDSFSYVHLADLMYYGKYGHPSDYSNALLFYSLSPNSGESLFHMAYMLENGLGTEKDEERALKLYNKIIELSQSRQIDSFAKFPAGLSKFFLLFKQFLVNTLGINF